MRSTASLAAQERFHRYVAVLFATTVPLAAVVEYVRATENGGIAIARFAGPMILTAWAIAVFRSANPNAIRLILGTMGFTGALVALEAAYEVDLTSFDFATSYGLVLLMGVLAATLAKGRRIVFAGTMAAVIATWVIVVGLLSDFDTGAVALQAIIGVAGVLFTTALISDLYDQLSKAIAAHDKSRRLQEAIGRCSEALLVHPDSFALFEAVRAVFEATDADFACISKAVEVEGQLGWEIAADASKLSDELAADWRKGVYSSIPTAYDALVSGAEAVVYTSELEGTEREYYADHGILSEVCVPIFIAHELRGTIGFVQYNDDRKWTEAEIQTLWRAADMVGAYWRRQDDAIALTSSNESKDKLLASVSHEIRTPLTAIMGLSEEIVSAHGSIGPDELNELSGIIAIQSRELAELVEDLLIASRADFGNLSIKRDTIDLSEQVDRVLSGVREGNGSAKNIAFSGGEVYAYADPLRVRQIIRNLVTNAIKYGGDSVVVALRAEGSTASVVVADNGVGVTEKEEHLIFERYYRSAESPTQPGSVGIGLAVSRQLAEMMDGTLRYVTDGSQHHFELTLPLESVDAKPRPSEFAPI